MIFLIIFIFILIMSGNLGGSSSSGNTDNNDYSDSYDSYDYSSDNNGTERFENRYPYEYDNETGYSRSDYSHNGHWTDICGNEYEQKTTPFGSIYYERINEDEDDD